MNYLNHYTPQASLRDPMTPEEAMAYLAQNSVILPADTLDVLRSVFEAGQDYTGNQSCGCC